MEYRTIEPGEDIAPFVKCYWTLEGPNEAAPTRQRIVPDGCMEMIFHHGDLFRQYMDERNFIIQPRCFVFGQVTRPLEIEPTGRVGIFSVRFMPGGFKPFATIPVTEMENRAVPLGELFGEEAMQLEKRVLSARPSADKIKIIETFLLAKLVAKNNIDNIVRESVELLLESKGHPTVDELSDQLGISRRQLERKFSSMIGLSPKQLAKVVRLQATLKMLKDGQFTSLTSAAYEGQYYDQAHFIKDFKEFTGMSPKKFYASNLKMSSLFIGSE